jgi:hypothetical protein
VGEHPEFFADYLNYLRQQQQGNLPLKNPREEFEKSIDSS